MRAAGGQGSRLQGMRRWLPRRLSCGVPAPSTSAHITATPPHLLLQAQVAHGVQLHKLRLQVSV